MGAPPTEGLILAGGAGRRMGGMKPFVLHRGQPLIAHAIARLGPQVSRLAVNVGRAETDLARRLAALGLPVVADDPGLAGLGPLSGVQAGLARLTRGSLLVTLPCDMPDVPADLARRLIAARAASGAPAAYVLGARAHPLCAVWAPAILPPLTRALAAARAEGGLRVMRFLEAVGAAPLRLSPGEETAFANVNDPAALDGARKL